MWHLLHSCINLHIFPHGLVLTTAIFLTCSTQSCHGTTLVAHLEDSNVELAHRTENQKLMTLRGGALIPNEFWQPWKAFDRFGNLNGDQHIKRRRRKTKKLRKRNLIRPRRYAKHVWTEPMMTPFGIIDSPNPKLLEKPQANYFKFYDYYWDGLPPVYYRPFFRCTRKGDHMLSTFTPKPRRKRRWRRIHMFWRRIWAGMFDDAPGDSVTKDIDVPVSGIDRADRYGHQVNWTKIYADWPFQEEIEENMEKELDQYEDYIVRSFFWKCLSWGVWIGTIVMFHKRHPYVSNLKKWRRATIGHFLSREQQALAYKDGIIGIEDLDFRKVKKDDFFNPRYDDILTPEERAEMAARES